MRINEKHYKSLWEKENFPEIISIIDQRKLPYFIDIIDINSSSKMIDAIKSMALRGAPLIGVAGAYAAYLACLEARISLNYTYIDFALNLIKNARPTAVNLIWAINKQEKFIASTRNFDELVEGSLQIARDIYKFELECSTKIAENGVMLLKDIAEKNNGKINILTHCNAGWLATIDYGTATAPIYKARDLGIDVHVWVDETRPRNQGAKLTAFELYHEKISHSIIVDNAGGHLMQKGFVDCVIVGCDRVALNGDVCNKIGTYLKALAAFDNGIPFYVAMPSSTLDFSLDNGVNSINIEERDEFEVLELDGLFNNSIINSKVANPFSRACNPGFDVTPSKYVSKLISEKGLHNPNREELILLKD